MAKDPKGKGKRETKYVVREIPYEGEVGAGRLYPFVPKEGTVAVAVPDDIPEDEPLGTMTVSGISLERVGIYDGDIVVVRKIQNKRQIKRDTVCVCYVKSIGEVVAKKITFDKDYLLMHYCGMEAEPPMYVPAADVEIKGIVISTSRHHTEWPFIADRILQPAKKSSGKIDQTKVIEAINRFKKFEPEDDFEF